MKQTNEETTRIKKYSDLRKEISNMDGGTTSISKKEKSNDYSPTKTIPINNNEGMDTEAINIDSSKNKEEQVKNAPIYQKYQRKKIISICLYALAAIVVLILVIVLIVNLSQRIG